MGHTPGRAILTQIDLRMGERRLNSDLKPNFYRCSKSSRKRHPKASHSSGTCPPRRPSIDPNGRITERGWLPNST